MTEYVNATANLIVKGAMPGETIERDMDEKQIARLLARGQIKPKRKEGSEK